MGESVAQSKPERRWYRPSPDRFVVALLVGEGFLWLSEQFRWLPLGETKGLTALIAVAVLCLAVVLMAFWFVASLLFRWRFQFRPMSLFVLTLAVAIPCSWLTVQIQEASRVREAVESIGSDGGRVHYDYQYDGDHYLGGSAVPPWLSDTFGPEFFGDVVEVRYDRPQVTVTDDALVYLQGFSDLKKLSLHFTQVTDQGLVHLEKLGKLELLDLTGTAVTDDGLEHLRGLTELRTLRLFNTEVTDAGLEYLRGMTELKELSLLGTQVTDAGLERITGLTKLADLDLWGTQVTDAGLVHLQGLARLERLELAYTGVTDEGVETLQRALPKCTIHH